jgi:hypothetical protein
MKQHKNAKGSIVTTKTERLHAKSGNITGNGSVTITDASGVVVFSVQGQCNYAHNVTGVDAPVNGPLTVTTTGTATVDLTTIEET